jgi:hypothetical protein
VRSYKHCTQCTYHLYLTQPTLFRSQDWKSHKEYCLTIKAAAADTFDAILLAMNETTPRLIKVPWELKGLEAQYHKLDHEIWFKQPFSAVRPLFIHRWGINGAELAHTLCLVYDDNFSMNESPINQCVEAVTGGMAGHWWRGNILVLRMGKSCDFYASVDTKEDWKPLVRYLEEYGR